MCYLSVKRVLSEVFPSKFLENVQKKIQIMNFFYWLPIKDNCECFVLLFRIQKHFWNNEWNKVIWDFSVAFCFINVKTFLPQLSVKTYFYNIYFYSNVLLLFSLFHILRICIKTNGFMSRYSSNGVPILQTSPKMFLGEIVNFKLPFIKNETASHECTMFYSDNTR